jgi:hypothetical protein
LDQPLAFHRQGGQISACEMMNLGLQQSTAALDFIAPWITIFLHEQEVDSIIGLRALWRGL